MIFTCYIATHPHVNLRHSLLNTTAMAIDSHPSSSETQANLPPPRKSQTLTPVPKPFSQSRFNRFIYGLALLAALLAAFSSWRVVSSKPDITEYRFWREFVMGRSHPAQPTHLEEQGRFRAEERPESVDDKIKDLAAALGVPSNDLASAIADAVRSYVPPASLSSVAKAEGTPIEVLLGENHDNDEGGGGANGESPGVMGVFASGMESLIDSEFSGDELLDI
jgi:hypothetical protein